MIDDPRLEAEDIAQARGEYETDERRIEELANNLTLVLEAARETREGTMTLMQALRRGGFFEKAN